MLSELFTSEKQKIEQEYEVSLTNTSCRVSNKGLRFWEAACSWLGDDEVVIQLRTQLETGSYFGYSAQEIIQHELVHALRFWEIGNRFEELLACEVASAGTRGISRLRRLFPALFQTHREALLFVVLFCLSWTLGLIFSEDVGELLLYLVPTLLIVLFCGVRMFWNQHILKRVLEKYPLSDILKMREEEILKRYTS